VAKVDEGVLTVAAPCRYPPRHPVARGGFGPRREPPVLGPHRGDLFPSGELVRERLDPGVPDPPELLAPVLQYVGKFGLVARLAAHRREPSDPLRLLNFGDF